MLAAEGHADEVRAAQGAAPVGGRPMIEHVLGRGRALRPPSITVVVGHRADAVRRQLCEPPGLRFVVQEPQLGTAHALQQTEPLLAGRPGTMLLLSGDVPLLTAGTLAALARHAPAAQAPRPPCSRPSSTALRLRPNRPRPAAASRGSSKSGTRRRLNGRSGKSTRASMRSTWSRCSTRCAGIASQNAQGEYYLTDLVAIYRRREAAGRDAVMVDDPTEIRGINSRTELAEVSRHRETEEERRADGGRRDARRSRDDLHRSGRRSGPDTVIHPGVIIEGRTRIGPACEIQAHVRIVDSTIGDRVTINNFCLIVGARGCRRRRRSGRLRICGRNRSWARAQKSATSSS